MSRVPRVPRVLPRLLAAGLAAALVGCGAGPGSAPGGGGEERASLAGSAPSGSAGAAAAAGAEAEAVAAGLPDRRDVPVTGVLAVSVDGLGSEALELLGPEGAPVLHALVARGATTLEARTAVESTETLPNHTSMLSGHRVARRAGGHGVTVNEERNPGTVHDYAGRRVASVFDRLRRHGRVGAFFGMKRKFRMFDRSWPLDRFTLDDRSTALVDAVLADLRATPRAFRFVHLADPDVAGHEHGFLGAEHLAAVAAVDAEVGRLLDLVATDPRLAGTTVLLTADHGGEGRRGHWQAERLVNHRVPFLTWGAGVAPGTDLYALNPDRLDPGTTRPSWRAPVQPVRNAEVANLALDLLGLPPVPGSVADARQDLDLR